MLVGDTVSEFKGTELMIDIFSTLVCKFSCLRKNTLKNIIARDFRKNHVPARWNDFGLVDKFDVNNGIPMV